MTAEVAKEMFGMKQVYARIANPDNQDAFESLGIRTVCSTSLVIDWLVGALAGEHVRDNIRLFGSNLCFSTIDASEEIEGLTLSKLEPDDNNQMVFGLLREGRLHMFAPDLKIRAGDMIVVCTQS
jgi:Trk K+ transport system NAD-binding subunit